MAKSPAAGVGPHLFIVVGEESGDALAAPLIDALRLKFGASLKVSGLAGPRMQARGVQSLFPIEDVAVMGLDAVIGRLPTLLRRISMTAKAAIDAQPDAVLIVDSPDFTHRVAKKIRRAAPDIPIISYVSPSVWAWRPGRAKAMRRYVDHLLALLPFEPGVHQRLGGPDCTYVGHRIIEDANRLRPASGERPDLENGSCVNVLVLPGSRHGELVRHMPVLKRVVEDLGAEHSDFKFVLPAVEHLKEDIDRALATWSVRPSVVLGEDAKCEAFRKAHVAIAASGTVTLELALAQVPTLVFYKLDWFYRQGLKLNRFLKIAKFTWISLPNIILNKGVFPEFIEDEANPERLINALRPLVKKSVQRAEIIEELGSLQNLMGLHDEVSPSQKAAHVVARYLV